MTPRPIQRNKSIRNQSNTKHASDSHAPHLTTHSLFCWEANHGLCVGTPKPLPAAASCELDLHDQTPKRCPVTHTHTRTLPLGTRKAVVILQISSRMPSRPRSSKVTKHNANDQGPNGSPVSLGLSQMALPLPHSSPLSNIGGGDGGDNFSFTNHPTPYPTLSPRRYTAAELAYSKYGAAVKLDSALSRKVANKTAKRSPTQRRSDQKLNIDRRSNMEAFLAHVTGQAASKPCKNCHKGHGPWKECVVYDGQMCGSCTNCWYNASGSRCTFHGK
ncbi:hypothetical protein CRV24_001007 [Beauveria bassiana]|nr:hypothetical protein CRV24_001007 [Beauveria bassiana]